jgi:hypothetical protein
VSFEKSTGKYEAYVHLLSAATSARKKHRLGTFILAADAALARDKCLEHMRDHDKMTFASEADYAARCIEAPPKQDVVAYLMSTTNKIVSSCQKSTTGKSPGINDAKDVSTIGLDAGNLVQM